MEKRLPFSSAVSDTSSCLFFVPPQQKMNPDELDTAARLAQDIVYTRYTSISVVPSHEAISSGKLSCILQMLPE